ncbi:hypothetical protein QQS21_008351 [Conoideocrella luteorostrata]|uniref:Uncharacterized protein n=1 Tax=Conoideocrella luteorostrata TaxID=1105319 RepID=A0AAJ0CLQ9_9HYPO|nr:hypothetical protein QQS21_008351 [Conoideocrella luteorostrata]
MAKTQSPTDEQHHRHDQPNDKLPQIPEGAKIHKRPLTRPQLPASAKSPTIYMSSKTPFISAVRRVRKSLTKSLRPAGPAPKHASLHSRVEALERSTNTAGENAQPLSVTVMGTGKAIEKTLSLASWFEQEGDCHVRLRTRTVKTVDDVVLQDGGESDASRVRKLSCLEVIITLK